MRRKYQQDFFWLSVQGYLQKIASHKLLQLHFCIVLRMMSKYLTTPEYVEEVANNHLDPPPRMQSHHHRFDCFDCSSCCCWWMIFFLQHCRWWCVVDAAISWGGLIMSKFFIGGANDKKGRHDNREDGKLKKGRMRWWEGGREGQFIYAKSKCVESCAVCRGFFAGFSEIRVFQL